MPGKHRLYMHCPGLCEDQLYVYLQQFGRITDVYLPKNLDGTSKGYGFASFESDDGLTAALEAGDEHSIGGKAVRVNRAGPRPAPPLGAPPLDSDRLHAQASSVPLPGGISRQHGGNALPDRIARSTSVPLGQGPDVGSSDAGSSRPSLLQGAGPRIYVGGIPNAVSETMVRNYFSNWGKVEDVYFPKERSSGRRRPFCFVTFASQKAAEKAVAQSNREISGYQVASISMTADRVAHYQQVTGGPRDQPMVDDTDQPGHALSLQSLLPHLTTSLPGRGRMHGHEQGPSSLAPESIPGPSISSGAGGHLHYTLQDLSTLNPSLFGYLPQGQASLPPALPQPLLTLPQQSMLGIAPHAPVPPQLHDAFLAKMASTDLASPALFPASFPSTDLAGLACQNQLHPYPQQIQHGFGRHHGGVTDMFQTAPVFGNSNQMLLYAPNSGLPQQQQHSLAQQQHSVAQQQSASLNRHGSSPGQDQQGIAGIQEAMMQAFDPTVRRPGQNFSKASSVSEDPVMEPYLALQILTSQDVYGPQRPVPNFRATRHAPY